MNGLERIVSFALSAKCCAPKATHALSVFLHEQEHGDEKPVHDALAKFPALPHFMRAIAAANGEEPYSDAAVEAYLFGNSLLEQVTPHVFEHEVLQPFAQQKLPVQNFVTYRQALAVNTVKHNAVPATHTFDALLNVAREWQQGRVRTDIIDNVSLQCQVSWGVVRHTSKTALEIVEHRYTTGTRGDGTQGFVPTERTSVVVYDAAVLSDITKGSLVALHHGTAFAPITERQRDDLEQYARRAAGIANAWIANVKNGVYRTPKALAGRA